MKTLYLDCGMGAAGDMLTAALLELMPEPDVFVEECNALGIPDVTFIKEVSTKCGITGTHVRVTVNGVEETEHLHEHHHEEHHHSGMRQIEQTVAGLHLPEKVKKDVLAVYALIAEAESHVHGVPVSEIHFHEVGTMDAVADITAVCMLMDRIAPDKVVVSPIHVGSGHVKCAHGILPVPAPATAYILQNVPIYGGGIKGELCTPTGAALLKHFAAQFGDMPMMKVHAVGYGMGAKDFATANCVRAMLGETMEEDNCVLELSCNVDDMTAEAVGFAMESLFGGGALEVYTVPVGMKKSRPGILLRVICNERDKEKIISLIFHHTTTLGIRETISRRYILDREIKTLETPYGPVRKKTASGYGVTRSKLEYDDLTRIAKEKGISMEEVRRLLEDID
ncbi:MAG: nickel pincer cofactor biosynthesis protein LarC [bacterium]|nr:nickel pincer cofactor biosynthesis protein LarC [bacterium]